MKCRVTCPGRPLLGLLPFLSGCRCRRRFANQHPRQSEHRQPPTFDRRFTHGELEWIRLVQEYPEDNRLLLLDQGAR